jgi:hypothetical protein
MELKKRGRVNNMQIRDLRIGMPFGKMEVDVRDSDTVWLWLRTKDGTERLCVELNKAEVDRIKGAMEEQEAYDAK